MPVGVITNSGLTALLNAQLSGSAFAPSVVKVSSDVLACTGLETDMTNIVWTAPSSAVIQTTPSQNLFRTILTMDSTIGNFTVGTLGLYTTTGVLFALGAFPGAGQKIANSFPEVVGNIRTLYLDISYADISGQFATNLTTITNESLLDTLNTGIITAGLFLTGNGPPSNLIGQNGCMYLDTANNLLYGPLTSAGWGGGRKV